MEETHQGPGDMWQGENWALRDTRMEVAYDLGQRRSMFQGGKCTGCDGAMMPAGTRGRSAGMGWSQQAGVGARIQGWSGDSHTRLVALL